MSERRQLYPTSFNIWPTQMRRWRASINPCGHCVAVSPCFSLIDYVIIELGRCASPEFGYTLLTSKMKVYVVLSYVLVLARNVHCEIDCLVKKYRLACFFQVRHVIHWCEHPVSVQ